MVVIEFGKDGAVSDGSVGRISEEDVGIVGSGSLNFDSESDGSDEQVGEVSAVDSNINFDVP
jgi:hypothetical protein